MRCNWQRWLWGLIPLIMLSAAAIYVERDRVQADLIDRARAALGETGSRWASINVEGRDVVLTGRAVRDADPPRAEETVRNLWGVRVVDNRATLPPTVEPFVWSARRRGDRIRLAGHVPDRGTRQALIGLAKAAMPGVEVTEKLRTARRVKSPDTWLAGLSFALKQMSFLKNGEARFEDLSLTISGEAEDAAAFKAINTALKTGLPKGITLAAARITAPVVSPFLWSAQFAGGQLVLAGHVAGGEKTRQDLLAAAKAAAPNVNAVDRMEPAEGAPPAWTNVATALLKELVRLENGVADMKDATLTVGGLAQDEEQAKGIRSALRASVPPSFTLVDQIRVREVKAPEPAPTPVPAPPVAQTEVPSASMVSPPMPDPAPKTGGDSAPAPPAVTPEPQPSKQAAPAQPAPIQKEAAPVQPPAPPAAAPRDASGTQQAANPPASPGPAAPPQAAQQPPAPALPAPSRPTELAAPQTPLQTQSPEVRACQQELNNITSAGHIHFATDSAKLDSASYETLDRLAAAAKACPGVRIAIEGHTDGEGRAGYNQRLSVRRARAVVSYLIKAGADRKQFLTVGYGPTRPAAPNDTEENMAKNRRIEFSVQQQ